MSIIPHYGNWGGPNWSAKHEFNPGDTYSNEDLAVPWIDSLDHLFYEHDMTFYLSCRVNSEAQGQA